MSRPARVEAVWSIDDLELELRKLPGVRSAGFDEFDAEAVSAVTRAAPFPPMNRQFAISMPISFDNPLVR